jgi:transcription-repair coupling factor (superfamily II helicase)
MRVLGCEATARVVTLHLREDTPLDPSKVTELVRKGKGGYRITPDMRLSRRFDGSCNGLTNAETMMTELAHCLRA